MARLVPESEALDVADENDRAGRGATRGEQVTPLPSRSLLAHRAMIEKVRWRRPQQLLDHTFERFQREPQGTARREGQTQARAMRRVG